MDQYGVYILATILTVLYVLEWLIPLRQRRAKLGKRYFHNIALSLIGMPMGRILLLPLTYLYAGWLSEHSWGLLHWVPLPGWSQHLLGILALDYGIYVWHRLMHRSSFLWRFHSVHHADLDMDITTGLRFHFGEMLLSIPFRLLVLSVFGVPPLTILLYEIIFEAATMFHHSNIRLPRRLELFLAKVIITPRQHGIHHSIVARESNSNYGTVFNWWDRLHGSSIMTTIQDRLVLGVPAYQNEKELSLGLLLTMPGHRPRPWQLPDGTEPLRAKSDQGRPLE